MTTAYFSHPACARHDMGGHPECPERMAALDKGLAAIGIDDKLDRREAPLASLDALKRVHDAIYVDDLIASAPERGLVRLDGDTAMNAHSMEASRRAAGSVVAAVDAVMGGETANAFCGVRPPGHHAEHARAMGFCFFDSVAVGAAHALAEYGLSRVAILDFDVHHGNGTEDVFRDESRVLFCSTYQNPLFPFTDDTSVPGRLVKTPLRPGTAGHVFRSAVERDWLPALEAQKPELILVSAGFDAHRLDPLADLRLEDEDFAWVTERLCEAAASYCGGRLVSTLEGGYSLEALATSAAVHVQTLAENGR